MKRKAEEVRHKVAEQEWLRIAQEAYMKKMEEVWKCKEAKEKAKKWVCGNCLRADACSPRQVELVRAEQSARKGKARAPVPEVCARCIKKMLLCELGTGKSTSCQACKVAKAWCERLEEEEMELKVVHRRKCMKVELPCSKKKKVQTEELSKGSEKSNGGLVVKEVRGSTLRVELKLLFQGLFTQLNHQNNLLEDLLQVKTQEVVLLLGMEVNEMEEMDKEEDVEVNKEEVRELLTEGPKEVGESEEGPGKVEGSKHGVEALGSVEVAKAGAEKGLEVKKGLQSAESGGSRDDEMEV